MLILTNYDRSFDLQTIPDQVDLNYAVLDNSNSEEPDFFFPSLVYMESFSTPTIKLKIGDYLINLPVDYSILIGEPSHGDLEVIQISSLNDRYFKAFSFNPLSSFRPEFYTIEIDDVLPSSRWFMPKLKTGQLLCVPLDSGKKPKCIYIVKDIPKASEIVRAGKVW
jgi:hypothetical protein